MQGREVEAHANRGIGVPGRRSEVTIRSRLPDRTARRRACRQLFSEEFRRGLRLLRVASDTRGKALHLLRKASWHRRERAGGFRDGGRLPRGGRGSAQNPASWAARLFWWRVDSQG